MRSSPSSAWSSAGSRASASVYAAAASENFELLLERLAAR